MLATIGSITRTAQRGWALIGLANLERSLFKALRVSALISLAMLLGLLALLILFPGGNFISQVAVAAGYLLMAGFLVGRLMPRLWILSGLTAWGGVVFAALSLNTEPVPTMMISILIITSLGPAFFGGYLSTLIGKRRN